MIERNDRLLTRPYGPVGGIPSTSEMDLLGQTPSHIYSDLSLDTIQEQNSSRLTRPPPTPKNMKREILLDTEDFRKISKEMNDAVFGKDRHRSPRVESDVTRDKPMNSLTRSAPALPRNTTDRLRSLNHELHTNIQIPARAHQPNRSSQGYHELQPLHSRQATDLTRSSDLEAGTPLHRRYLISPIAMWSTAFIGQASLLSLAAALAIVFKNMGLHDSNTGPVIWVTMSVLFVFIASIVAVIIYLERIKCKQAGVRAPSLDPNWVPLQDMNPFHSRASRAGNGGAESHGPSSTRVRQPREAKTERGGASSDRPSSNRGRQQSDTGNGKAGGFDRPCSNRGQQQRGENSASVAEIFDGPKGNQRVPALRHVQRTSTSTAEDHRDIALRRLQGRTSDYEASDNAPTGLPRVLFDKPLVPLPINRHQVTFAGMPERPPINATAPSFGTPSGSLHRDKHPKDEAKAFSSFNLEESQREFHNTQESQHEFHNTQDSQHEFDNTEASESGYRDEDNYQRDLEERRSNLFPFDVFGSRPLSQSRHHNEDNPFNTPEFANGGPSDVFVVGSSETNSPVAAASPFTPRDHSFSPQDNLFTRGESSFPPQHNFRHDSFLHGDLGQYAHSPSNSAVELNKIGVQNQEPVQEPVQVTATPVLSNEELQMMTQEEKRLYFDQQRRCFSTQTELVQPPRDSAYQGSESSGELEMILQVPPKKAKGRELKLVTRSRSDTVGEKDSPALTSNPLSPYDLGPMSPVSFNQSTTQGTPKNMPGFQAPSIPHRSSNRLRRLSTRKRQPSVPGTPKGMHVRFSPRREPRQLQPESQLEFQQHAQEKSLRYAQQQQQQGHEPLLLPTLIDSGSSDKWSTGMPTKVTAKDWRGDEVQVISKPWTRIEHVPRGFETPTGDREQEQEAGSAKHERELTRTSDMMRSWKDGKPSPKLGRDWSSPSHKR